RARARRRAVRRHRRDRGRLPQGRTLPRGGRADALGRDAQSLDDHALDRGAAQLPLQAALAVFTGIVERVGRLARVDAAGERLELEVEAGADIAREVRIGDSVALAGCCLTVVAVRGERLAFQAVPETLRRTSLGARRAGDPLNVERAMRADARLDGHIVQGHVDGTGTVRELRAEGDDLLVRIDAPRAHPVR